MLSAGDSKFKLAMLSQLFSFLNDGGSGWPLTVIRLNASLRGGHEGAGPPETSTGPSSQGLGPASQGLGPASQGLGPARRTCSAGAFLHL